MQEHSKHMKPHEATGVSVTIATSIGPRSSAIIFTRVFDRVTSETPEQKFHLWPLEQIVFHRCKTSNHFTTSPVNFIGFSPFKPLKSNENPH